MDVGAVIRYEVRPGTYCDSVVLMRLQRALAALPGVLDAGAVMATEANLDLLAESGLLPPGTGGARADDLLIVVKAETEAAAAAALARVDELLVERRACAADAFRPRSLAAALKQLPAARWVLVSVPGRHAAGVARDALDAGRHVFVYSDNVPLAAEVELKRRARSRGLLVLGPDCGTALVGGVGFGFANRVRRGRIGVVAASGTGLQAVATRIHVLGAGVSHAIGTGGRDLSAEVGGVTAIQGLELLGQDPDTAVIVLLSKPPDPAVATGVLAQARATGKPVVVHFQGYPPPGRRLGELHFAVSLSEAAELAVALEPGRPTAVAGDATSPREEEGASARAAAGGEPGAAAVVSGALGAQTAARAASVPAPGARYVRGLFSGGTLAVEALLGLQPVLWPLYSNVPLAAGQRLDDPKRSRGHTILDLGADAFTAGRPHPMLDPALRMERLAAEAADPEVGAILLDVVLGESAHPDPAGELAPAIRRACQGAAAAGRDLEVVVVAVGTAEDPQGLVEQERALVAAGARVVHTVTEAVEYLAPRIAVAAPGAGDQRAPVGVDALEARAGAVNVGLEIFYESLIAQGVPAVQVDWRPPAGGDERLAAILERVKS